MRILRRFWEIIGTPPEEWPTAFRVFDFTLLLFSWGAVVVWGVLKFFEG